MGANLQDVFLKATAAVLACFGGLCLLKYVLKAVPRFWGTAFRALADWVLWLCLQLFLNLAFLASYVLYVKNGTDLGAADLGVAFIAVSIILFFLAWRGKVLSDGVYTLLPAGLYSAFLLYRFFAADGGLGFFGYVLYNPMFAFIGSNLQGKERAIACLSAVLPLVCGVLGRGLALKRIDKS